jgi:hypothetical protein
MDYSVLNLVFNNTARGFGKVTFFWWGRRRIVMDRRVRENLFIGLGWSIGCLGCLFYRVAFLIFVGCL